MKTLGAVLLFMLAGLLFAGGLRTVLTSSIYDLTSGMAVIAGAFVLPCVLTWWGVILLRRRDR